MKKINFCYDFVVIAKNFTKKRAPWYFTSINIDGTTFRFESEPFSIFDDFNHFIHSSHRKNVALFLFIKHKQKMEN